MLGTKRPDRHALLLFTSLMTGRDAFPPARAGSFYGATSPLPLGVVKE
jgi:hypothetical protein